MSEHYGVLLDEASVTLGDLDLTALISRVNHWDRYPTTTDEDLYLRLKNATIVVINKVSLNTNLIEPLPRLKLILLTGTGTDRVDFDVCRERGITVCNVTDYGTSSIAQHVFSLIRALSTNLLNYSRETASGAWTQAELSYPITELEGKPLGLIGYGNYTQVYIHLLTCNK